MYKHIKLKSIICLLLNLCCFSLFAQQQQIRGRVYDQSPAAPFGQVSILLVNNDNLILTAYKTEADGTYDVVLSNYAAQIIFSWVGYVKQGFSLSAISSTHNVTMQVDDRQIEEEEIVAQGNTDADLGFITIN